MTRGCACMSRYCTKECEKGSTVDSPRLISISAACSKIGDGTVCLDWGREYGIIAGVCYDGRGQGGYMCATDVFLLQVVVSSFLEAVFGNGDWAVPGSASCLGAVCGIGRCRTVYIQLQAKTEAEVQMSILRHAIRLGGYRSNFSDGCVFALLCRR
ncbi:hypothetical protein B0T14DRAFT_78277 [Immersiella caudata]|uniref:Uncharacterized protein n=1 Tax=Immersiella caudata TaxID=314043 RepID=A0AA39XGR3_9PEZI|nr:hypothetical protein B0T14DRAFT_78277 [Immersiella caudata]